MGSEMCIRDRPDGGLLGGELGGLLGGELGGLLEGGLAGGPIGACEVEDAVSDEVDADVRSICI